VTKQREGEELMKEVTRLERVAEARLELDLEYNRDRARSLRNVLDALHEARFEKGELTRQLKASQETNKSLRLLTALTSHASYASHAAHASVRMPHFACLTCLLCLSPFS
jgi:hypothetical protein